MAKRQASGLRSEAPGILEKKGDFGSWPVSEWKGKGCFMEAIGVACLLEHAKLKP
jgi:hypothetical protein